MCAGAYGRYTFIDIKNRLSIFSSPPKFMYVHVHQNYLQQQPLKEKCSGNILFKLANQMHQDIIITLKQKNNQQHILSRRRSEMKRENDNFAEFVCWLVAFCFPFLFVCLRYWGWLWLKRTATLRENDRKICVCLSIRCIKLHSSLESISQNADERKRLKRKLIERMHEK